MTGSLLVSSPPVPSITPSTIAIVLNATSGSGTAETVRDRIEELFAAAGRAVHITVGRSREEIQRAIEDAIAGRAAALVAGGGDGTLSSVASALVHTSTPLGVLPLGTLNHFAKDVGIPVDLDAAVAVLLAGHTTQVDVGEVNGRIFLNNASLGLYPRMVRLRQRHPARGLFKWLVALWALFTTLARHPRVAVRIDLEGERMVARTPIVLVGNNAYAMSGFEAGTRATLRGGKLAVYVLKTGGRPRVMQLAWRLFTGQALRSGELDVHHVESATVELTPVAVPVAMDGEVFTLDTPLEFRIRQRALTVLVPEALDPTSR